MPRIFKGSESTLRLLIHKCNHYNSISDLKIVLFTGEDIDNHIEVVDGINVDGNMAVITLPARAFNNLEEGVINYIVEGVIDGDLFATERQSNYYLKAPLSYVVNDGLQIKDEYITENGNYTIYPDDTYDGMSQVNLFVEVPDTNGSYDEGYNIGRGEGYNDGYANGQNDGYNSGREEVISQAESLYLTENGVYEGENLYNRVEVAVDVEEQYNKGYEDGANAASSDAIVVDVTENGIYYTPYATEDLPEFNATLTGDDFYSYIEIQGTAWDTGYQITNDSTIEFWYKTNFTKSLNGIFHILGVENGLIMKYSRNDTWFTFEFGNGESFTIPEMKYEEWSHYIITKDKIIIDGVEHILPNEVQLYGDSNFLIGAGGNINEKNFYGRGQLGMVKIDGNVFIPTYKGFAASDGRLLNRVFGTHMYAYSYPFSFNKITKPISFSENLFKRVNVTAKLDVVSSGLKFSNYATILPTQNGYTDKLPDWLDVPSNIPNLNEMFKGCIYLKDITPLTEWYTGNVTSMVNTFNACENITNLSPLANWDVSLVTTMQGAFGNCKKLTDISALANWDVKNVKSFQDFLSNCEKLTDISALVNWDISKVTTMQAIFSNCKKLTDMSPIANWDTSKVTEMRDFFYNIGASEIPYMNCISVSSSSSYPFCAYSYTAVTGVTKMGGFLMKTSSNDSYGLVRYTNLDYESCINILTGLYDFTGHNETPTSSQGKLKVHKNFLDLVGDEISIGTNKGWTITA